MITKDLPKSILFKHAPKQGESILMCWKMSISHVATESAKICCSPLPQGYDIYGVLPNKYI